MGLHVIDNVARMTELAGRWSFSDEVALVPTMGFLHDGHLSLVRHAARQARTVVVSIFVNPLQFGPAEDFDKYPRNFDRDAELLAGAGATHIFAPQAQDITPKEMTFTVDPGPMATVLCGKYRPGHFTGVCTIVSKLFNITRPGHAAFGWKDAQQFLILRKMVADLNIPVSLTALETAREADGLAMSSRNTYLTVEQRQAAPSIYRGLTLAKAAFDAGELRTRHLLGQLEETIKSEPALTLQYAEAVNMETLEPVDMVTAGNTLIAVAVFAGETRLIDNIRL